MTDFEALHISRSVAEAVTRLGWTAEDPVMRDAAPTAARGHNLVAWLPPGPAAATPVLAGLLSRLGDGKTGLLLAGDGDLEEWASRLHLLTADTALHVHVARSAGRAARRLRDTPLVDLLVCSPEVALALHRRSALRPETLSSVVMAWPEAWGEHDIAEVMQDVPKETQRIILGSTADETGALTERYARRALEVSAPGLTGTIEPAGPIRTVSVGWGRRVAALADLFEMLDPAVAAIWTLDRGHHAAIRHIVPASDPNITLTTGDVARVEVVIAFDPPTPSRLRQLLAAGEVVVLAPPAAESYVRRIAATRRPLRLPGWLDAATSAAEARRATVAAAVEQGGLDRSLHTLAPLLERYDASAVAAALFELWTRSGETPPAAPAPVDTGKTAKVFVGVGKKHGATVNDLVAVLTKEVRIDRGKIGRVELREGFMLVEIPEAEAERVVAGLSGTTIRRTRVVARIDRAGGRGTGSAGGAGRAKKTGRTAR